MKKNSFHARGEKENVFLQGEQNHDSLRTSQITINVDSFITNFGRIKIKKLWGEIFFVEQGNMFLKRLQFEDRIYCLLKCLTDMISGIYTCVRWLYLFFFQLHYIVIKILNELEDYFLYNKEMSFTLIKARYISSRFSSLPLISLYLYSLLIFFFFLKSGHVNCNQGKKKKKEMIACWG